MTVQFAGKFIYPDMDTAMKAHGLPTGEEAKSLPSRKQPVDLPCLKVNRTIIQDGRMYAHFLQAEDEFVKQYPGVVVLTDDNDGQHMTEIMDDLRMTHSVAELSHAYAPLLLGDDKKRPLDLRDHHYTLAAIWDPEQLKTNRDIALFPNKRLRSSLEKILADMEQKLAKAPEANKSVTPPAEAPTGWRRAWHWLTSWLPG